ncbi:MAG: zinc ribbon domain-containing protein [Verrucomicrobiae bacterium]|nr:zinc ribbon domain-containing protein [Verrucomicrobiae bacterium]
MPLYEFHCGSCKKDSEILVRSSNWKGTECPHCGSTKLTKNLSVFASATAGNGNGGGDCATPQSCGMPTGKKHGHGGGCPCC